jgi:hypothetical protein
MCGSLSCASRNGRLIATIIAEELVDAEFNSVFVVEPA